MYTNDDARFDHDQIHGDSCLPHGDSRCKRCCYTCGFIMEKHGHADDCDSDDADEWRLAKQADLCHFEGFGY
jgi:hypothetical protein